MSNQPVIIRHGNALCTLYHGDSADVLPTLAPVDAVVTDPPYGLRFMGKAWDYDVPSVELWRLVLAAAKPGAHLLSFAGTRTQHRMAVNIEDAGFEIRDMIAWVYGSGFPKSLAVDKAIDRMRKEDAAPRVAVTAWVADQMDALGVTRRQLCDALGVANQPIQSWTERNADYAVIPTWERWLWLKAQVGFDDRMDAEVWRLNGRKGQPGDAWAEREVVGVQKNAMSGWDMDGGTKFADRNITAPATDAAKQWAGWGTALKPALEPITVARKPLVGTVAENVLRHGTGAINVDGCRVDASGEITGRPQYESKGWKNTSGMTGSVTDDWKKGRWPANLIHDGSDEVVGLFPQTATSAKGPQKYKRAETTAWKERGGSFTPGREWEAVGYGDSGSAARFFYTAKASGEDRGNHTKSALPLFGVGEESWRNPHPTVKPIALMRYLVRLVTRPGGIVLDPFMGSGSTGIAALREGFNFIGIERDPAHFQTACERIEACKSQRP